MIDRIEIYKGVVPAKFGGSAVGGAVNIVIKEYPPKYLDVNYSYGSFNTHNASVVSKMNIAPKGIEFGLGGFYTYADNDYKMKSPFQEGLTITRDHDKFKKTVIGGSFKARKWWFDLVEFEPVFIHTYKDIQGIESNIRHAHSHSNAFIFANKMERKLPLRRPGLGLAAGVYLYRLSFCRYRLAPHTLGWNALSGSFRIRRRNRQMGFIIDE